MKIWELQQGKENQTFFLRHFFSKLENHGQFLGYNLALLPEIIYSRFTTSGVVDQLVNQFLCSLPFGILVKDYVGLHNQEILELTEL